MRILFILIGIVFALPSGDVRADGTAILIVGNAPQHERELSQAAMATSIQAQGRKVIDVSFSTRDVVLVKECVSNNASWTCMKAAVASRGIDQLVIASVDAGTSPMGLLETRLSGYLVVSDLDFAIAEGRHCSPCTDDVLKSLASDLAQTQLRRLAVVRGRTNIALHTTPPGAIITLDGEAQGASDIVISTYPGSHTVRLELDGHHVETRTVEVLDGKTVDVNVTMRPKSDGIPVPPPYSRPSRRVPILIGIAGVAAVITGGVLIAINDPLPPPRALVEQPKYYYPTRTPGIVTAIGGAAAIGLSVYLWRRQSRSAVTAARLSRGAAVTWMTTF